jgi:hypothetical protein
LTSTAISSPKECERHCPFMESFLFITSHLGIHFILLFSKVYRITPILRIWPPPSSMLNAMQLLEMSEAYYLRCFVAELFDKLQILHFTKRKKKRLLDSWL